MTPLLLVAPALLWACRTDLHLIPHQDGGSARVDTGLSEDTGEPPVDEPDPTDSDDTAEDADEDTAGEDTAEEDTAETDPSVEICNGRDDDGDGLIDEGDACEDEVWNDPVSGHAYLASVYGHSWQSAFDYCESLGYHLVIIDDAAENELVWEFIYDGEDGFAALNMHTWIGYADPGDGWAWVDGSIGGFDAFSGEVVWDDWGSPRFGQAAAYGDYFEPLWHEAPGNWVYAALCESEG